MRMFRRTAIAVGLAGIVAAAATVRAGAGPLPTSIAAVKAAAPSAVVEARWGWGGGWRGGGWRGGGWGRGWGAGAFVGGLAAGAIIASSSYGYYQNAYYGGYPYYGAYAPGYLTYSYAEPYAYGPTYPVYGGGYYGGYYRRAYYGYGGYGGYRGGYWRRPYAGYAGWRRW